MQPIRRYFIVFLGFIFLFSCNSANEHPLESADAQMGEVALWPVEKDGKWGFINAKGEMKIQPRFDFAREFSQGLALVDVNKKRGFIRPSGNYAIAPQFFEAASFSNGLAAITKTKKFLFIDLGAGENVYINRLGETVIENDFFELRNFSDNYAAAKFLPEDKFAYFDQSGNLITQAKYDWVSPFDNGVAAAGMENGNDFIIDKQGNIVKEFSDTDIFYGFASDLCGIFKNNHYGFVDNQGNVVIRPQFDLVDAFSDELAVAKKRGEFGYINKNGEFVIEPQFEHAGKFSQQLAPVKRQGKWGYINTNGEIIVEPQFYWANPFNGELAKVEFSRDSFGYINQQGEVVWKP
ncbi:hypothetical protein GF340_00735 [Candidatus Peregrinibacteria bacterium]|nr:hypothetical protein [Candidatus Peregrinibacteria bacterium]